MFTQMQKSEAVRQAVWPMLLLCMVFAGAITAAGQKNEHYNSPLYSPRKYDPAQQTANGIPEPLKKVGIEQKLGEQLPLETKFKDENGNIVALGDYFKSGRPDRKSVV